MKIFISADMEGLTATARFEECRNADRFYKDYQPQMTAEVLAACEGAIAAGADEIVVKDAHDSAANIEIEKLPECVKVLKGWSGHPYSMVEGIDNSFDGVMFIGYHCGAGNPGNPLSHTMSGRPLSIKMNGSFVSEFTLYSYAAAYEGVPTLFLSGDKAVCQEGGTLHPGILTMAVKEGNGNSALCLSPQYTRKKIKELAEKAVREHGGKKAISLPETFYLELCFKEHGYANQMSYYPGMKKKDANTLIYESKDYFEVLRMIGFVV